jgi:ketosteroid isomerase-like protein
MQRKLFFVFLLLVVLALLVPNTLPAQSRDEREIRSLLDRFIQSANSTDEKLVQQDLADHSGSGGPFFLPFVSSLDSFSELEALVKQSRGQVTARSYEAISPINLHVDRNIAWAAYTWRATFTLKDGTQHGYTGRATAAFAREGKGWKFAHWHSSIVAPEPLTAAAREAEAERIIAVERNAWEAIKARQPEGLASYFADDASIFSEGSAYRMTGKANLVRGLAVDMESTELRAYQMLEPQVRILGDTALLTYYFTEEGSSAGKDFSNAGKISVVFVRRDGTWRALQEHRSTNRGEQASLAH